MSPFQHILVPIDFGSAMHPGVQLAVAIAGKFNSRITLVYAFDALPYTSMSPLAPQIDYSPMVETAERELKTQLAGLRAVWPASEATFRRGPAYEAILEAARDLGCDLIVIGTRSRSGLAQMLLGSIAEKVVRLSPIPVLTVHPAGDDARVASAA